NPLDTKIAEPPGIAMANLFGDRNAPPRPSGVRRTEPKPSRVYVIQVFNGSKKTEQKFGSGEEQQ
ncbi:MAG TPA: Flp pilus assembly protein CpaB, partial [Silvibacterium sp.]|nr:Flp pilus assembly protein CpaB [Silvibacterium sp.]